MSELSEDMQNVLRHPELVNPVMSCIIRFHTETGKMPTVLFVSMEIWNSIGGGIGQSRTYMYLLRTAHLGEVSVTVWPKQLKDICAKRNINVLE